MNHIVHSATETVWRFDRHVADTIRVVAPRGARFLPYVETDGLTVSVWALVNPDNEPWDFTLYVRGTGHPMGEISANYLGTASARLGTQRLVWHAFLNPDSHPTTELEP